MREMLDVLQTDLDQYEAEWREVARRHETAREGAGVPKLVRPPSPNDGLPFEEYTGSQARAASRAANNHQDDDGRDGKSWRAR